MPATTRLTVAWAGAALCFLAGVRRGPSFRQPGGTTLPQLLSTFWLFGLGASALLSPRRIASLLVLGYAGMASLDPAAARRREVPRYFCRLRPGSGAHASAGDAAVAIAASSCVGQVCRASASIDRSASIRHRSSSSVIVDR